MLMRVFLTGATGFIGSAIVNELMGAGHQVLGLARSDDAAASLKKLGVEVHRGALDDLDSLKRGAQACDGVIHTAFIHDFSQFVANVETDRRVVDALASALEGSGKPLVITSGSMMVGHVRFATRRMYPRASTLRAPHRRRECWPPPTTACAAALCAWRPQFTAQATTASCPG
jgi:nucleoside-diphosphate-sugar epimerase